MQLHDLKSGPRSSKKRVGRGSTRGYTSGRGSKGQGARSGSSRRRGFEGGRTSLIELLPKVRGRGFSPVRQPMAAVNVGELEAQFEDGATILPKDLRTAGLIGRRDKFVKSFGDGELTKKLMVSAHGFSSSAKELIEKAGGTVAIVPKPVKKGAKPKEERTAGSTPAANGS